MTLRGDRKAKKHQKLNTNGTDGRMPRIAIRKMTDMAGKMLEDDPKEKVLYKDLSYRIVQACFEVHNILGPGYPEKIYEEAMVVELGKNTVAVERQKLIELYFKTIKIGEFRLDAVAENKILLEFKAVSELNSVFEAQVLSYLKASGLKLGLLINFGGNKVEVRRIVN